ncbi:MAG: TonB-dependent receptor [Bacteroidetes bacterium]|nr:TonB-dependent receptor [Bacteroidota bacterium]MBS1628802.1 TonB-dependent receptor [Bacteroidota bacterium]
MRALYLFVLFMGICPMLHAQLQADTLLGAEVHARRDAPPIKDAYSVGAKRVVVDSATLDLFRQQSLGALLAARSTAFVKSTGLNTFSTLSLRGASAAQSAVYWEGVPLMNSASGLVDVSLLSLAYAGKMWIDYGSSAALRGSGNVGGAIMLADEKPFFRAKQEWQGRVGIQAGSFSQYGIGGHVGFSSARWFASIGLGISDAANDYPAEDERGHSFRMPHAYQRQWNSAVLLAYQANERTVFSLHGQWASSQREIPPALFEAFSSRQQEDQDGRWLLQWQQSSRRHPKLKHYAKLAFLDHALSYQDSSIGLQTALSSRQLFGEAGWELNFFKKGKLLVFAPVQYSWLKERTATQFRAALATALSVPFFLKKDRQQYALQTALNFRFESFNGTGIPLPGANLSLHLSETWLLRGNVQYTYRAPTLNEWYFQPGGNESLRPEQGWSYEAGLEWNRKPAMDWRQKHSLSIYQRDIRDWIIWLGGAIWTPHNLASVRSRGLESDNEWKWNRGNLSAMLSIHAAYISSIVQASALTDDSSVGKQLPYVPPFMANTTLSLAWNGLMLQWSTAYVGFRYTLSDESNWLDAYTTSDLGLVYILPLKQHRLRLQLLFQNIFNKRYQVVAFRPMPGFNWNFGAGIYL